jgi:hypothetical protein
VSAAKAASRADYLHDALDDLRLLLERKNVGSVHARARRHALELIELAMHAVDDRMPSAAYLAGHAVAAAQPMLSGDDVERFETAAFLRGR